MVKKNGDVLGRQMIGLDQGEKFKENRDELEMGDEEKWLAETKKI